MKFPKWLSAIGGIFFFMKAGSGIIAMAIGLPLVVSALAKTQMAYIVPIYPVIIGVGIFFETAMGGILIRNAIEPDRKLKEVKE